jgi:hypothetical protein
MRVAVYNNVISIKVPIKIKRHGGRKLVLPPDGATALQSPARKPDETLLRALAKAHLWQAQLDKGMFASIEDLARRKKINPSYASRILRLNLLAPAIKQGILDGTQPRTLSLQELQKPFPDLWGEQEKFLGFAEA